MKRHATKCSNSSYQSALAEAIEIFECLATHRNWIFLKDSIVSTRFKWDGKWGFVANFKEKLENE